MFTTYICVPYRNGTNIQSSSWNTFILSTEEIFTLNISKFQNENWQKNDLSYHYNLKNDKNDSNCK